MNLLRCWLLVAACSSCQGPTSTPPNDSGPQRDVLGRDVAPGSVLANEYACGNWTCVAGEACVTMYGFDAADAGPDPNHRCVFVDTISDYGDCSTSTCSSNVRALCNGAMQVKVVARNVSCCSGFGGSGPCN